MSRPISTAPESPEAARAYVVRKWGAAIVASVDHIYQAQMLRSAADLMAAAANERDAVVRQLWELLNARTGLPVVVRSVGRLAETIAAETRSLANQPAARVVPDMMGGAVDVVQVRCSPDRG